MIFDNGSANGIKFDGEKESDFTLTNGMEFEIGDVIVEFTLTNEECDQLTDERFTPRKEDEASEED